MAKVVQRAPWRAAGRLALALAVLAAVLGAAESASKVMEMTYEDFDDNNVPVYDGPGDFIALAFYSSWDLRVSTRALSHPLSPSLCRIRFEACTAQHTAQRALSPPMSAPSPSLLSVIELRSRPVRVI